MARDPDLSLLGRTIGGKFAIESVIGGGAMGAVYRARQVSLDKAVAIKVIHRELSRDPTYVARFLREARAASRIDHPSSVRVIDFGEDSADGLLYLAMELLDGRDLYTVLRDEGPLDTARIGGVVLQMLAAVAAAHEMGVVHRDIKPENIMILRGTDDEGHARDVVKVCDFGVAKITERRDDRPNVVSGPAITIEGLVVGTPEYMSPEQGRGETLDARSDLYSVGIILYQMLAGRVPYDAESALGIVLKHVTEEPVRPSQIRPEADPALEAVCLRAMQKKREDRYQTAREMRADVRAALESRGLGTANPRSMTIAEANAIIAAATEPPLPVAAQTRDRTPVVGSAAAVGTADTAVAFDSSAIRALQTSRPVIDEHEPPSSLSPAGVPRTRLGGIVIGAMLLAGAFGVIAIKFRDIRSSGESPTIPSASTTAPSSSLGRTDSVPAMVAPPDPVASASAPRGVPPPARNGGKQAQAAHTSSAVPVARAPNGAIRDAGAVTSVAVDASAPSEIGTTPDPAASISAVPAPSGPWQKSQAKVTIGAVRALGVSPAALRKEVPDEKLQRCYRSSLSGKGPRPPTAKMTLHLDANEQGQIGGATLNGSPPIPKEAGNCIMKAMMGKQITSEGAFLVSADVDLTFSVE